MCRLCCRLTWKGSGRSLQKTSMSFGWWTRLNLAGPMAQWVSEAELVEDWKRIQMAIIIKMNCSLTIQVTSCCNEVCWNRQTSSIKRTGCPRTRNSISNQSMIYDGPTLLTSWFRAWWCIRNVNIVLEGVHAWLLHFNHYQYWIENWTELNWNVGWKSEFICRKALLSLKYSCVVWYLNNIFN